MSYQIKQNGERVILHVLAGADKSLIGLKVRHCSIIAMTVSEFHSLVIQTRSIRENNHFFYSLLAHHISVNEDDELIVLEAVETDDKLSLIEAVLLPMLKLYNSGDIYSCYFISYRYVEGRIVNGGRAIMVKYAHAIGYIPTKFGLTEDQFDHFPKWFDQYFPKLYRSEQNNSYRAMLRTYDSSYLLGVEELEYIMLFSILEMLFGTGNTEITYQISRGTALLLSSSSSEMKTIFQQMKKLYTARSKYVHNGTNISIENLFELREIVRRVLIKLVDLNYHTKEKSFDDLRTKIMLGGYYSFADEKKEE